MPPKGKQATKGQKQIAEENQSTLQFYVYVIGGVNIVYYSVWYFFYWDLFTMRPIVLSLLTAAIYFGSYKFMSNMAQSVYQDGHLVDAGTDLNMESGMAEHSKDLILLTSIVQSLSLLSGYFWLFLLLAPARVLHILWVNFLGPWFFAPAEEQPVDDKKQKKLERKMKRQQIVR
ncbi:transmembrane protein 208 [Biomphalaria glabrata]|nr:transmembrane protein 208-like [Biomphalaria glabrata]